MAPEPAAARRSRRRSTRGVPDTEGGQHVHPVESDHDGEATAPGDELILNTDGASRGNPGPAGAGAVLRTADGRIVEELYEFLGVATNNEAEYRALIMGLAAALRHAPRKLTIRLDSELIVRQVEGRYKVKNARLAPLHAEVENLLARLPCRNMEHVGRSANVEADRLANRAIDRASL